MEDRLLDLQSNLDNLNVKLIQLAWKINDVDKKIQDGPEKDIQSEIADLKSKIINLEKNYESLESKFASLETTNLANSNYINRLPTSNLLSESLWKRMWAVFGHGLPGYIMLIIVVYVATFVLGLGEGLLN